MKLRLSPTSPLGRPTSLTRRPLRTTPRLPAEVRNLCQLHISPPNPRQAPSSTTTTTTTTTTSLPSTCRAYSSAHYFGQPTHETHPHILPATHLTPSIPALEYHTRRLALAASLPAHTLALLPSAAIQWRSGAVFHRFRQESNFLYLTGFSEPEALCAIHKTGTEDHQFVFYLLVRPKDPALEQWSGPWSGVEAAEEVWNADVAGDIKQAEKLLAPVLKSVSRIYTDAPAAALTALFPTTPLPRPTPAPLKPFLNAQRVLKSPAELLAMRHAGRHSGRALTNAMRRRWATEHDLASYLDYAFTAHGLAGPAYVPVVAGGARAGMIHYVHNDQVLRDDELVLVDAGGEYGTYIADITRTWPVAGKFSAAQRDLYGAVLSVQRAGVAMCRADRAASLDDVHRATEAGLKTELSALGFDVSKAGAIGELFPHHVGHYVGLDVHDCPGYGRGVALKAGMCVTVEPGVYVPDDERWPKHFRGMGVRIEDSVAVDAEGPVVLSVEAVKEVVDIEALRS